MKALLKNQQTSERMKYEVVSSFAKPFVRSCWRNAVVEAT